MKRTILLLLATFAIIIASNHVASAQNMLTNPGFEDWTAGAAGPPDTWDLYNGNIGASQEGTIVYEGTYSANVTWTNTNTCHVQQVEIPVTGGNSYQFSFWALDNDPGGRVRVAIRWYDEDTAFISGYYGGYTSDSPDWQQLISGAQQAPDTAIFAHAEIRAYDVSAGWTGSATVYVDDALFEDVTTASAVILDAYAVSTTAVDVVYDKDIISVSSADFTLSGSASISFAGATIDGTDANIVHLTGASVAMAGDIVLDNIADLDNGSDFDFYAGIMPIAFTNTNNPAGTMLDGYTATFQGVISADDAYSNVWLSDAAGQYNGVMIFDYNFWQIVNVGDEVLITSERATFSTYVTELINPELISLTPSTPYPASVINGSDIEYLIPGDNNPAEPWEGQLVKIETFTVDSLDGYSYWCSWSDAKADYIFKIGDNVDYHLLNILINVGQTYPSITGVVDWDYYENYYRINPRDQYDIEGSIAPATQLAIVSVNGGSDPEENSNFSVVVQAWDYLGNPTLAGSNINITLTTDGGDLGNVDFVAATTTTGTILAGTSEITLTEVQMAPVGTNVTISANDDALVLTPGQSAPFDVIQGISYIVYQGFEQSGDTWNYITDPPPYNVSGGDVWDSVASVGSIASPAVGDRFWGIRDIDGPVIASTIHYLDLEPIDISSYPSVELSFQYYTVGFDAVDSIGYVVEYDNGTSWGTPINLEKSTLEWTPVTIALPPGSGYVRLRLWARQNGSSDYAGWDDIKLLATAASPPTKLAIISVNGGGDPYENTDFEVIVQSQDADGVPSAVANDLNFTLTTDGGDLGTVGFVGGTTTTGLIATGSSAIVLSGVQMAPTGTNVTITASDNNPFGLSSGSSAAFDVVEFVLPDLIISEIMPDPSAVIDANGEWFEVYNNGISDVDLLGFVIKDEGTDSTTIGTSVVVTAGGFVTLGRNANSSLNGNYTCDYQYSGLTLGNNDDEIILCLPDGLTEIDRVEYDGGFLWPNPTATSMVFTGFSTDDNNVGSNWTKPYRREASFVDAGDNGSPGTNGYQQLLTGGFKLSLKAFLEGPYDTDLDMMDGSIFIPQDQPYNPATPYYGNLTPNWLYAGSDRFNNFSGSQTDWVIVELRDAATAGAAGSASIMDTRAAMLLDDGSIVALNGISDLSLNLSVSNNLFIVIRHRNHLGIMSATGLTPTAGSSESYDYSTGSDKVYGGTAGYVELETGVWGMASGDVNADGAINISDNADGWSSDAGNTGYLGGDLDFSGQSNNQDKNDFWVPNVVTDSQVPN